MPHRRRPQAKHLGLEPLALLVHGVHVVTEALNAAHLGAVALVCLLAETLVANRRAKERQPVAA